MHSRSRTGLAAPLVLAAFAAFDGLDRLAAQPPVASCGVPEHEAIVTAVHDRATRVPLAGATVTASWTVDQERVVRVQTDSAGRARVCAPAGVVVTLRVSYHHLRAGPRTTTLDPDRPTVQTFSVDAPGAFVRGSVLEQETGTPIANAAVSIAHSPLSVMTTSDGRFEFEQVPLGDYVLRVTHISYMTVPAPLRVRTDDLDATIRLAPYVIPLEPMVVTSFSRRLDHVGFYEREKRGMGTFIGRAQIDAMNAQTSSDLLRRVPSVRLTPQWPRRNAPRNDLSGRGRCRFSFIVDGARTLPDFEMDFVAPYLIEGIEVYRSLGEVPAAFRAHVSRTGLSGNCGVIAIWTRNSR